MQKGLVNIGRIIATQGNRGEVKVLPLTGFPNRFKGLKRVYIVRGGNPPFEAEIERVWNHKGFVILKLKGYDNIARAKELKDYSIALPREERMKLRRDEYYLDDLIGLEVVSEEGQKLGCLIDVVKNPGNDIYIVKGSKEWWLPAAKEVVKKVDLRAKRMIVHLIEGLENI